MDLQGEYQKKNLRTVLAALDVLSSLGLISMDEEIYEDAIVHTASRTGFRGRWEKVSDDPWVICDIGHNEHGLRYNFAQLDAMLKYGKCSHLIIVYGSVADKDVDASIHLMPENAHYIFTCATGKRALPAEIARDKYLSFCASAGREPGDVRCCGTVPEAVREAFAIAAAFRESDPSAKPLIYVGGSTYVVSEAVEVL
jgi:dihydrofolate synthase/folylpolyglutamate synthase